MSKKEHHRKGIATKLFEFIKNIAEDEKTITVKSSPYAVPFYHNLGFIDDEIEQLVDGIRFTPMTFWI